MEKKDPRYEARISGAEIGDPAIPREVAQPLPRDFSEASAVPSREQLDLPRNDLLESMHPATGIVDAQGRLLYCSPSLARLLSVPPEEAIGSSLKDFVASEDQSLFQQLLVKTEFPARGTEIHLRGANGPTTATSFSFLRLSSDNSITGFLVADLTSQRLEVQIAARLRRVEDEERRHMARQLHDSVGQLLVATALNLSVMRAGNQRLSLEASRLLDDNLRMIDQAGEELRAMSHRLHPPLLDQIGLVSALRGYVAGFTERSRIEVTLDIPGNFDRLPSDLEIAIYRAVEEALTNVDRHSGSLSCWVTIERDAGQLQMEIRDSGSGIPQAGKSALSSWGGNGLCGVQQRMRQLGGTLDVRSSAAGTRVLATLPLPSDDELTEHVA